jgi:hypothetical protein
MIGKHRPYAAGRLQFGRVDNLRCQPVNTSAVARQPLSVGLLIPERRKLVYQRCGAEVIDGT